MILRVQDQGASDRDPLAHAAGELVRILVRVIRDIEPDPGDPAAGMLVSLSARHALAFQAERDVVEHRAVVEAGVVLKNHAAVGAGPGRRVGPSRAPRRVVGGCCGRSPAISRRIVLLPQPLGPRMQMNSPLSIRSSTTNVTLRIAVNSLARPRCRSWSRRETRRRAARRTSPGCRTPVEHPADADRLAGRALEARDRVLDQYRSWCGGIGGVSRRVRCPSSPVSTLQIARRRSSQACSTPRTRRCKIPMPP